ncbi:VPLPA-CTERM sorting domain-containing protein [Hyphococcus flavus]|uniref:VPLPA-CTERM sorting domain-containing protein n=1 Tax=Hyphococcus flavus TaxID=1866326 RepID=A0AAF0CEP4_9PROT|nr:VPLPA-CTERM sorting domain-containing protein [Hyphococcus flavus]WDI31631.1 VPLPA-CTERM sorting domain-containing protein [Hyphococcus flavus]
MKVFKASTAGVFAAASFMAASAANAAVIGVTVDPSDNSLVGETEFRSSLGADAIRYFIPLENDSGVYGVDEGGDFGLSADSGDGGGTLSMYILFDNLNAGSEYVLDVMFEDLDLAGANDPNGFFESLQIFSADGATSLTGLILDISNPLMSGDAATQQLLSIALGAVLTDSLVLRFDFIADASSRGTNTAEFLVAEVQEVPLPAALPLFIAGLAGLGFAGRNKKKTS